MTKPVTIRALNDLLALEYRSLPMYVTDAMPWTHPGDAKSTATLASIVSDQKASSQRIAQLILDRGGALDTGEFPMEYTDMHDLSLDFLVKELVSFQKWLIGQIEQIVKTVDSDRDVRELAQETLGSAKAHLEALHELTTQPA
jgi:hypothetical protein